MVIATNVIATVITDPRAAAPLNGHSVDTAILNGPNTNIRGPPSNASNAVNIAYDADPH